MLRKETRGGTCFIHVYMYIYMYTRMHICVYIYLDIQNVYQSSVYLDMQNVYQILSQHNVSQGETQEKSFLY